MASIFLFFRIFLNKKRVFSIWTSRGVLLKRGEQEVEEREEHCKIFEAVLLWLKKKSVKKLIFENKNRSQKIIKINLRQMEYFLLSTDHFLSDKEHLNQVLLSYLKKYSKARVLMNFLKSEKNDRILMQLDQKL